MTVVSPRPSVLDAKFCSMGELEDGELRMVQQGLSSSGGHAWGVECDEMAAAAARLMSAVG